MKKIVPPALAFLSLALCSPMAAKFVSRAVDYEQGGVKFEGFLVYDDARTAMNKLPGVLVVPEWWGVNDYVKSARRPSWPRSVTSPSSSTCTARAW